MYDYICDKASAGDMAALTRSNQEEGDHISEGVQEVYENVLECSVMWNSPEYLHGLMAVFDTISSKGRGATLFPALKVAAEKGSVDMLRMLFEYGADVNYYYMRQPCDFKESIVFHASSIEVLRVILDQKPNLHNVDSLRTNALFYPPFTSNKAFLEFVLEHDRTLNASFIDELGRNALFYSTSVDVIDILVQHGANVNQPSKDDGTPLFRATAPEIINALARHGADVNALDNSGQNVLFQAIPSNVSAFVELGVDVTVVDHLGRTPLFYARSLENVNVLAVRGVDIDAVDCEGKTALFFAKNAQVVHGLVNHGINLEARDINMRTAIFYATSTKVADAMFMRGADLTTLDMEGKTPLFSASSSDILAAWLVKNGCHINHCDAKGRTALYHAFDNSEKKKVEWLMNNNARFEVRARNNKTPLDIAWDHSPDIFDLALHHHTSKLQRNLDNCINLCGICYDATPNVRFHPCGHTCCSSCAGNLRQPFHCHLCRAGIARTDTCIYDSHLNDV